MNTLTTHLKEQCHRNILEEKWLLAPNLRVGYQWLETIVRNGTPVLNVHVKTLTSLALHLAASEMDRRELRFASPWIRRLLIERVLDQLDKTGLHYLGNLKSRNTLIETVLSSIETIRMAGLTEKHLKPDQFEHHNKARDLTSILCKYQEELHREKLVDSSDVFQIAARALQSKPELLPSDVRIFYPQDLEFHGAENTLLKSIPDKHCHLLHIDGPAHTSDCITTLTSNLDRLRWINHPEHCPAPLDDSQVKLTQAIGEINEVRGVLRNCLANGISWDEVELLHTDHETYGMLVYETLSRLEPTTEFPGDTLPVTFAEGISCRYSRPGKALRAWLAWVNNNFPQATLVHLVKAGLIHLPDKESTPASFSELGALLRKLRIGFGKQRYLSTIRDRIHTLDHEHTDSLDSTDSVIGTDRNAYEQLEKLVESLMAISDSATDTSATLLIAAKQFLESSARSVSQLDHFASQMLIDHLDNIIHWIQHSELKTAIDATRWLDKLVLETRVLGSGPRPGCLHVDSIYSGGHSDRRHTYILGLDDRRFPGPGQQDPLLLDRERRKLSDEIPTSSSRIENRLNQLKHLFFRLRGTLTLSFSCHNVLDDRDMFPSPILLQVYRILSGNPEADQEELIVSLPKPISFAPNPETSALDTSEWWLWRLSTNESVAHANSLILDTFPDLKHGQFAIEQNLRNEFTPYDGHVTAAGTNLDPTAANGPVVSASQLQTMATCPRQFFFQYALDISPPEELIPGPTKWLDSMEVGRLLHELFEQSLREISDQKRLPEYERDHERLQTLLNEKITLWKQHFPPRHESSFQSQVRELEQTAATFLREEENFCKEQNASPVYFEASLGLPPGETTTPLDHEAAVEIKLSNGKTIATGGRIDRVDRIGEETLNTFAVWDYKTGSDYEYKQSDPLQQGRKLQPYLYLSMVAHRLRETISQDAQIVYFGFFFPGSRAAGARFRWTPEQLSHGNTILQLLCDSIACGSFIATTDKKTCDFCPYIEVCGDVDRVTQISRNMLDLPENTMLKSLQQLRQSTP